MKQTNWIKIEQILEEAVLLPEERRHDFIKERCGDDEVLKSEIFNVLYNDLADNSFLNEPLLTLGLRLIDSDSDKFTPGAKFASYKFQKLIGRGGMGIVFLAEDTRLERLVAVKVLANSFIKDEDAVQRFQQEAKAASNVSHQNVAHVYEFSDYEGRYFLAMEYVPGRTLRNLIKENLIDRNGAINIACQIAAALVAAHKSGIVHRDIKPENIIITDEGLVKVLDFGLAKVTVSDSSNVSLPKINNFDTIPGIIIGTTPYMSPEQVRGYSLDTRSDIWSLGIVFYEMLTGQRPFIGSTYSDIQASILRDEIFLKKHKLPKYLETVIKKSLEKDRLNRYQTATEFSNDLKKFVVNNGFFDKAFKTLKWQSRSWFFKKLMLLVIFGVLTLAMSALLIGSWQYLVGNTPFSVSSTPIFKSFKKINSIAVMHFQVSGEIESDVNRLNVFGRNFTLDLTEALGKANQCRVIAQYSAYSLKNNQNVEYIRNKLHVDAFIRGFILTNLQNVEVQIELVDAQDGAILWLGKVKADNLKLANLRLNLMTLISANLEPFIGTLPNSRTFFANTPDSPDYESWYENYRNLDFSDPLIKNANVNWENSRMKALGELVKKFPNYSDGYLTLSQAYWVLAFQKVETNNVNLENAKSYAFLAVFVDKNSSKAHAWLAKIKREVEGDWKKSEEELLKAIEINPNNDSALLDYVTYHLMPQGKFDESLSKLEKVQAINPLLEDSIVVQGQTRFFMKNYQEALSVCNQALEINSQSTQAYIIKSRALMKLGQQEEALEAAQKGAKFDAGEGLSNLGVIYAARQNVPSAYTVIKDLESKKKAGHRGINAYDFAVIYVALGDSNKALQFLKEAAQARNPELLDIRLDPLLDPVREDPRFKDIEKRVQFAYSN